MGEELNLDTVEFLEGDDLFGDEPATPDTGNSVQNKQEPDGDGKQEPEGKQIEKTNPTETVIEDGDDLFGDESESVGGEDNKGKEKAAPDSDGSSPEGFNAYSSFAKAMKGDGLFQFLEDEVIDKVNDADSFAEAMEKEIDARLDDTQKRIKEALDAEVPADTVKQYMGIMERLDKITDEQLDAETEQASRLRQNILYQDFLNKGYKDEKAKQLVKRAVDGGTDKEDAKEALESAKQYYQEKYDEMVQEGKERVAAEKRKVKEEIAAFKKSIFETEKLFGNLEVDKATRQKAYDAMTRFVDNDEDGNPITVVQKFADENPVQFRCILGLTYAMTNGFKDMGNIINETVNKKVRSNLKEIEDRIIGSKPRGGSPKMLGGDERQDSSLGSGSRWTFDI